MPEETKSQTTPPTSVNPKVMDYLRLWHERMAHANLKAIVILGRQGDTGEIPEGLPKGPEEKFEAAVTSENSHRPPKTAADLTGPKDKLVRVTNADDYITSQDRGVGLTLSQYLPEENQQDQGQAPPSFGAAAEPPANFMTDPWNDTEQAMVVDVY
ncbi:hypothetical protein F5Y12DRAFT_714955 [Xylaria sp. FL1777]|nr:hypothetical protein F5Y12DRAFT_714955 [Xylaria sp. FL1777]